MDTIIRSKLLQTLQPNPAVRIRTEVGAMKDWDLLRGVQGGEKSETVGVLAWNRVRILMEYKKGNRTEVGALHRDVLATLKITWPYRNLLTPFFMKNESNRTT